MIGLCHLLFSYVMRANDMSGFLFRVPQDVVATGGKCSLLKWVTGVSYFLFTLSAFFKVILQFIFWQRIFHALLVVDTSFFFHVVLN
jgi:hypothetical protein